MKYFTVICTLSVSLIILQPSSVGAESPFTYDSWSQKTILPFGAGLFMGSYFVLPQYYGAAHTNQQFSIHKKHNILDKRAVRQYSENAAQLSNISMLATLSGGIPLLFLAQARNDFWILGIMSAEVFFLTAGIAQLSKTVFLRPRPYYYNQDIDSQLRDENRALESFYSRTTSLAFASSVFLNEVYRAYLPDSVYRNWVFAGTLSLATTTAYLRYTSGQHFPTDIATGAILGATIGYLIPQIHKRENNIHFSAGLQGFSLISKW